MTYKLIKNSITGKVDSVKLTDSSTDVVICIPFDEDNADYQEYLEWIQSSKLNNLLNLNGFKSLQFVHGTSQSFDFFYLINHTKRFRGFKGDFMYHKIMWKKGY